MELKCQKNENKQIIIKKYLQDDCDLIKKKKKKNNTVKITIVTFAMKYVLTRL